MLNVAMFSVFAGPADENVAASTKSLRRQFFVEPIISIAGFFEIFTGIASGIAAKTNCVCLVEGVNVSPLCARRPFGIK
jgi:hypothetical protein